MPDSHPDAHPVPATTPDLAAENLAKLKALFPEAVTEDGVNATILHQLLGKTVFTEGEATERYGLNWFGKKRARQIALTPSSGTLLPCPADSVDWDKTQNLFIEGDNLEVLKLLQKSYSGKVKLIYIDPPYNTGKDFVYRDDFRNNVDNYLQLTGQKSGDGRKLETNAESNGRFHTDWLNMMYPRLKLARNLLKDDGVIFVSIDDYEASRATLLLDEIFGEENQIAQTVWEKGRKSIAAQIAINHEYCLVYARDKAHMQEIVRNLDRNDWSERKVGLEPIYKEYDRLKLLHGANFAAIEKGLRSFYATLPEDSPTLDHSHYKCIDARGIYFPDNISQGTGNGGTFDIPHPATNIACKRPTGGWRFGQAKLPELLAGDRIHFGDDHTTVPCLKRHLRDTEHTVASSVFYKDCRGASKRLDALLGGKVFDFPKDEQVVAKWISYVTAFSDPAPLILDFFAGSGTTGHAVMAQNAADGGNRQYICVQLPEPLSVENKEQKVAAEFCINTLHKTGKNCNIAELTKERLRRAAKKIQEENPLFKGDLGFRVFKLAESNLTAWDATPPAADATPEAATRQIANLLAGAQAPVKPGRTPDDLLFELLLKCGVELTATVQTRALTPARLPVHAIDGGLHFACLAGPDPTTGAAPVTRALAQPLADAITAWSHELRIRDLAGADTELTVFLRDDAFDSDEAKANLIAALKQALAPVQIRRL